MSETTERPELPACAAIQFPDGTIIAGHRHHNCISMINHTFGGKPPHERDTWEQGFMTTKGRFVDRRKAFMMMISNDIPSASADGKGYRGTELYSEDLY